MADDDYSYSRASQSSADAASSRAPDSPAAADASANAVGSNANSMNDPAPVPPQTGANYSVERPNFGQRVVERVGGGVLSGVVAGAIRVGLMGFMIGAAIALLGTIAMVGAGSTFFAAFTAGILGTALPLAGLCAVGGALAVGGWKLITGIFGAAKDAITNPNKGAEMTQTPEQARGQEPEQGKGKDRPALTDDAITGPNEDRFKRDPKQFDVDTKRFEPDENRFPPRNSSNNQASQPKEPRLDPAVQQALREQHAKREWENRERIGFKLGGNSAAAQDYQQGQPTTAEPQDKPPIGFRPQAVQQAEASHAASQIQEQPSNYWVNKTGAAPSASREGGWADQVQASAGVGPRTV